MEKVVIAKAKFVKGSPRKMRQISDAIKHLPVTEAIAQLKVMPKRFAHTILLVYLQAVANAKNNFKISPDLLTVADLQIQEGPRFKRRDTHAHGARFDPGTRHKRQSHIVLKLAVKK